ncbi:MAG: tetratricopeptide repeat protein [Bacteroidales bacterium]|nr:tetratricopeptide repeat protein [Bacteroidales bacterium]
MNIRVSKIVLLFFLALSFTGTRAQVAFTATDGPSDMATAMSLFEKEKYSAAIRIFDGILADPLAKGTLDRAEAGYWGAISSMRLFLPDAEPRMTAFIASNPESPRVNQAWLDLGEFFYQSKNYRKAVDAYDKVHRLELEAEKLPAFFFKYGYSLMMRGDRPRAMLMFSELTDIDTDYTSPAIYYFAHLAYEDEKYQTAMDGFMKLRDDETFGSVVPFYIVQILYMQKDYDAILSMAPGLLSKAGKDREIEMYRFIGDAWYNKGDYVKALEYLEKFSSSTRISSREDKYQLAYSYYKTGEPDKAIKILNEIYSPNDLLSQNAWVILGACYLQKGDKHRARLTFGAASKMDFDRQLKEESLFNYAKLTYETSDSPFGEVITAFQEYINEFPGSGRIDEAYNYLVSTYIKVKNYQAALNSLDRITRKDDRLEEAYQKVAFFRGLELFRNLMYDQATEMLDKSLKYGRHNMEYRARAVYWRGESSYRLGDYARAIADYQEYLGIPGSSKTDEYQLVRYNLGYAHYNTEDYNKALSMFRSYEADPDKRKPDILADARNRIADCYYIATEYATAISYYDMVIGYGKVDADYAMYQKGFSQGLMNNQKGKVETLTLLMNQFPASYRLPDALFERGRAYIALNDNGRGETDLLAVISKFPESAFVPRAHVQLGLLYYNIGDNPKAIAQYKTVIEKYRSTAEARNALTGLKNSYVDMNEVDSYFAYVKTLGSGYSDINVSERDSLLYRSGENFYMTSNCERAMEVFTNYLNEFPSGFFVVNARFYLAECLFAAGRNKEAQTHYLELVKVPNFQYAEQVLGALADISFNDEDFEQALEWYNQLEKIVTTTESRVSIYAGQLRSSAWSGDQAKTIAVADKILAAPAMPEELIREAAFLCAKAHLSQNNFQDALKYFRKTAVEVVSAEGAESKYRVAELLFRTGETAESEKVVNEFIALNTPHQYWMARVFILLSDISITKNDKLTARATLQGLLDYYSVDNDGIIDEVKAKLEELSK